MPADGNSGISREPRPPAVTIGMVRQRPRKRAGRFHRLATVWPLTRQSHPQARAESPKAGSWSGNCLAVLFLFLPRCGAVSARFDIAMQPVLYPLAGILILVALADVLVTVFSTSGAGPLTDAWTRSLWRLLLFVHRRRRIHGVLALTGPFMLLGSIILWYLLVGLALFLVFLAHPLSVMDSSTGAPVDWTQKLYFVNATISSLGYGDMVPAGRPWTLIATSGTFLATLVLTVSISYVISVVAAGIERKRLAQAIFGLGGRPCDIIEAAGLRLPQTSLQDYNTGIATTIDAHTLKHLAYPILKYFHTPQAQASPVRAILLLSDTFFIDGLRPPDQRPPAGVQRLVENSIRNYAEVTRGVLRARVPRQTPAQLIAAARHYGVAESPDFETRLAAYLPLRRRLLALCYEDGWSE